jgi:hypothetical protein
MDNKADLVLATTGGIAVLLGNGDGTFQPPVTYSIGGAWGMGVATGDFNLNGETDVAVADRAEGASVSLGNGDGTLQNSVLYSTGGMSVWSVQVADVNGDGKPDLLVTNSCGSGTCGVSNGTVAVLLGNGDGTFQNAVTYDAGGVYTAAVGVGDLNGDGRLDLVVANYCTTWDPVYYICDDAGTVAVFLGNGDGTFKAATIFGAGGTYSDSIESPAPRSTGSSN